MDLSPNELRARAAAFAADWAGAAYEKGETQSFYNDFFAIFGRNRREVGIYEQNVRKLDGRAGFIDLFWPGRLLVEQKSAGRDLARARLQALDYINALKPEERPQFLLLSDFQSFELVDFETREEAAFALADLPRHIDKFNFILGRQVSRFKDQDPVNIKAAELVGLLHDQLLASGYTGHRLEVFLTRIVFCLFADDTGIFAPRDILMDFLDARTAPDGSDLGGKLADLFETLDTPETTRQTTLDPDLARFPYVNGHLFAEYFPTPKFNAAMREALLNACRFDWTPISPAIFGSLFQSVMNAGERRRHGAHYTTEKNILKLIGPLFLDDLRAEFGSLKSRRSGREKALRSFHDKLAALTFFDPACGCGNFLVITYRELRRLETELLRLIHADGQLNLDAAALSRVDVDQFYGIEIAEFPARIAETALWMMDHLMNRELSEAFGGYYPRIPLKKSPHIAHADALELDWASHLPPERCSYVLGNPPFVGAKFQSVQQREQVRQIANLGKSGGTLDFVAAWFLKAGAYASGGVNPALRGGPDGGGPDSPRRSGSTPTLPTPAPPLGPDSPRRSGFTPTLPTPRIAFVATNSITQGEQVAQLWPVLFDRYGLEIAFAHRTFEWGSDARGKAHVHVVIIGLDHRRSGPAPTPSPQRRLFSYPKINGEPVETVHRAISPYLFDAGGLKDAHMVVAAESSPLSPMTSIQNGSIAADGGHLVFDAIRHAQIIASEPDLATLIRPFVGAVDLLHNISRYCFWLVDMPVERAKDSKILRDALRGVREMRLASTKAATREKAQYPSLFTERRQPASGSYLAIPRTSSERREYIPVAYLPHTTIAANDLQVVPLATLSDFAMVTSKIHVAWTHITAGRLKSDIRYSTSYTYNTFPLPSAPSGGVNQALRKLDPLAQAILDARAAHPGATLATLYDPDLMPPNLRAAHSALDRAVDRLYRPAGFASDRERVEHLFALYEAMVAPLLAGPKRKR